MIILILEIKNKAPKCEEIFPSITSLLVIEHRKIFSFSELYVISLETLIRLLPVIKKIYNHGANYAKLLAFWSFYDKLC